MSLQQHQGIQPVDTEGMAREAGLLSLMWASEGSIIGSGWLFGALTAATFAGPSVIISWVVASIIVIFLALVHAELGGLFPVSGGTSRFPHYAFGSLAGATFGWFSYIQAATVAPIEVLAAIQYFSAWIPGGSSLYTGTKLTALGIVIAIALVALFTVINVLGIRWLTRANDSLTTWKVLIPVLTIIVFLAVQFHGSNFSSHGFFTHGSAFKSILIAIPSGGIVFSLLGFEQAVQLGGESANPKRDLPRAVIGSVLIGTAIYVLVQVAFIAAIQPQYLTSFHGWAGLGASIHNHMLVRLQSAPFATVATVGGLAWLAFILHLDAAVSPSGTGLIYLTSASRISFGLARNGYIPAAFERNHPRTKVPVLGIIVTAFIGILFLLPFPSWNSLVNVVTSASVLMYAGAPLALGALRHQKPELPRTFRLPAAGILAPLSFVLATLIVYWSGWKTYSTLMVVMVIGFLLMGASYVFHLNPKAKRIDWRAAIWVFPYVLGMIPISYFGGFGPGGIIGSVGPFKHVLVGGCNHQAGNGGCTAAQAHSGLPLYVGLGVVIVFALVIYYAAMWTRLDPEQVDENVADVYPPSLAAG